MTPSTPHPATVSSVDSTHQQMIDLRKVVKKFKNAAGEFTVLKGVDLQIGRGEFVAIVGKSGSGKSTLLNMITGIDHPTTGQVIVNDTDLYHGMNESKRSLWRGRNMGIVFQFFQLLPMLTLLENVMLPMDYVDLYGFEERPARALELLKRVGLEEQAGKLPLSVSTGQQQLAAIARALATDPPLIVADEPTGNLDSRSSDTIIHLFQQLVAQGKTVVMVTHDPSLTERTSRTVVISDGELVDEMVFRALPLLSHRQMLAITKQAARRHYAPGQALFQGDDEQDSCCVVLSGEVDVIFRGKSRAEAISSTLAPGQFFGRAAILEYGKEIAAIRAGQTPLELLTLPRAAFIELVKDSPLTEDAIRRIIRHNLEQGRSGDLRQKTSEPSAAQPEQEQRTETL